MDRLGDDAARLERPSALPRLANGQ